MILVFLLASLLFLDCGSPESKGDDLFDIAAEQEVAGGDLLEVHDALESSDVQDDELEGEEVSNPPLLYAKKVVESSDLIGGENGYGRVGESFVLGNSKARFLIQDKDVAVHLLTFGGNLIDMDAVREDGSRNDQFREMFPVIGFRTVKTDSVEVLKDGADGKEAVVRVSGMDESTGIIPTLDSMAVPLNIRIITDYILEPDAPYIKVRTTVENKNDYPLENMIAGDFISFGGAQNLFTSESGFDPGGGEYDFIVSYGRGASYGYAMKEGKVTVPLIEASGTIAINTFSLTMEANGSASFERYFVVGNGDIASVIDIMRKIRNEDFHTASGIVLSEKQGKPLSGVKVTAFKKGGAISQKGKAFSQAVTDKYGRYSMTLPEGEYEFVASAEGRLRSFPLPALIDKDINDLHFSLGEPGYLVLDIKEKGGGNIPAKVSCYGKDGIEKPWDQLGEWEKHGLNAVLFTHDGGGKFLIKPGNYRCVVSRGIEYEIHEADPVGVTAGEETVLSAELERSVDTTGYLAADFHQHTLGSLDAETTHIEKVIENCAEGVEFAAITDHDNITSYKPAIEKLGVSEFLNSMESNEISVNEVGHFNAYPIHLAEEDKYPFIGAKLWAGVTIPELFEKLRKITGVKVIQINHPRKSSAGYFSWSKYDPVNMTHHDGTKEFAWDFDSVEVKGSLGVYTDFLPENDKKISEMSKTGGDNIPIMKDWFSFLNSGRHVCAVGVSDAHNRNDGVGYSRTMVRVGEDDPSKVTDDEVADAIKAQRAVVSNGAMINVYYKGGEFMGWEEVIAVENNEVEFNVRVQSPKWIELDALEIYGNGRPLKFLADGSRYVESQDENGSYQIQMVNGSAVKFDETITLLPEKDTWYVFVVRGSKSLAPVGEGVPFAYTNPVYVDVGGNGFSN